VGAGGYVLSKFLIFVDTGSTSRVLFSMMVITSLARAGFPADVISCPFR